MNWLERHAQLQGEWWIIDGQAIFADSDVGDMGHEGYVLQSILSNYAEEIRELRNLQYTPEEFDPYEFTEDELKGLGMDQEEVSAIQGTTDPRDYGMKNLGWKRVAGDNVQTQTLSSSDLRDIALGLSNAYGDELEGSLDSQDFNIEVNATRTMFSNVPFHVIEKGNPMALREYAYKYAKNSSWYKKSQEQAKEWDLDCPECGSKLRLRDGNWGPYYSCENRCGVTHGAFKNGKPRGTPGDLETMALRKAAHEKFDRIWKMHSDIPDARTKAYEWLARKMKLPISECHMAKFNKEQLRRVIGISNWALEQYRQREEEKKNQMELDI